MATIFYTPTHVKHAFSAKNFSRGKQYFQRQKVLEYQLFEYDDEPNKQGISALVLGSNNRNYSLHVYIGAKINLKGNITIYIDGDCSCPMASNCKHVVAVLLQVANEEVYQPITEKGSISLYQQLQQKAKYANHRTMTNEQIGLLERNFMANNNNKPKDDYFIAYLLDIENKRSDDWINITPVLTRYLKSGKLGKPKKYSFHSQASEYATTAKDRHLITWIQSHKERYGDDFRFHYQDIDALIIDLMSTKRLFWQQLSEQPISQSEPKTLTLKWDIDHQGNQALGFEIEGVENSNQISLLPSIPMWGYNSTDNTCFLVKNELPVKLIFSLFSLPPIAPDAIENAMQRIQKLLPKDTHFPKPNIFDQAKKNSGEQKQVLLTLFSTEISKKPNEYSWVYYDQQTPLAKVEFQYNGDRIGLADAHDSFIRYRDGQLYETVRDRNWEDKTVEQLVNIGLEPLALNSYYQANDNEQFDFLVADNCYDEDKLLEKYKTISQASHEHQWQLHIDDSFPIRLVEEIDEWYSDLSEEGSGIDWFSLSLGVIIDGEKVNLLPLLVNMINHTLKDFDSKTISELPDDFPCELKLADGRYISVPFNKVRNILLVLCELFDNKPLDDDGNLQLSTLQAGLLSEIEKAIGATELRWFGGERLRQLANKLDNFTGVAEVKPAKAFKASLRRYQQQGLNWLQFLREYQLGGILADDMGLGKTVQTLAHFCIEKAAKRLTEPSLLVVPTSLIVNWEAEAKRFAPHLNLLILHGAERKKLFNKIDQVDLIITTYPLILRDKNALLEHSYYYLILDEAQAIKNARTKSTQIILQLKAKHRLCLTGTPMENHLGELWSLFHFVIPGLLGNQTHFKKLFRTPIERHNDTARHEQLIKRIKPFLLRRRKSEVVLELPEKTEMVRYIELKGAQRELYESIRISMEENVRNAINNKGLARSQILILDALLKLRQVCCAPSLLKLTTVKKDIESAKLTELMSFLPNMVEEGRRILLFSSFTSMLSLIETQLQEQSIHYVKLTGSTRDRKTPVEKFQNGNVPIFLISLKAGGVGLNLTTADTVIHFDPWWNPAAEQQATDRAHRIGQKNPVFVYKLITKGTVEEKILEMQNNKRRLIEGIVEQSGQSKFQLTQDDLNALFQPLA